MIREFLDENNTFNYHSIATNKVNVGGVSHETNLNQYSIKDVSGNVLMGFDENSNLSNSVIKTYCDEILGTVNEFNITQLAVLSGMQRQLTSLNNDVQNTPTDQSFTDLQNEVNDLKAYNEELKKLILAISESLYISKSTEDNSEFDYTNLL